MNTTKTAPSGYVTEAYDGPIFRRGETVRVTDPQGVVTVGRVQRVVLLHGYYDPSIVVMRYLAVEGIGTLVPSTDAVLADACPAHGLGCAAWAEIHDDETDGIDDVPNAPAAPRPARSLVGAR